MKNVILILMTVMSSLLYAQENTNYIDVLFLKDGSIIKGYVLKQVVGEKVSFKTLDNKDLSFSSTEILKIEKEEKETPQWINNFKAKEKGWFIEAEGVVSFVNTPRRFLSITNGYKFNRFAYLGLGLNVGFQEYYRQAVYVEPVLEACISFSGDILDKRITPFYQLSGGYSYLPQSTGTLYNVLENGNIEDDNYSYTALLSDNFGGPFGEIGLGVRIKSLKRIYYKFGLDMRVGSNFNSSKKIYYEHSFEEPQTISDVSKTLNSFGSFQLRFGIGF